MPFVLIRKNLVQSSRKNSTAYFSRLFVDTRTKDVWDQQIMLEGYLLKFAVLSGDQNVIRLIKSILNASKRNV